MKSHQIQISKEELKKEYRSLIIGFKEIENNETIAKWKILSQAYKIGKEIKGVHYNLSTLCTDFDLPFTTVKRILSLNKANEETWKKIYEGKVSAFKVAQILMSYDTDQQDKIIDKVIKENLSTYQIKNIRVKDKITFSDTSRKFRNFERLLLNIKKFNLLLEKISPYDIPKDKISLVKDELEETKHQINKFIASGI